MCNAERVPIRLGVGGTNDAQEALDREVGSSVDAEDGNHGNNASNTGTESRQAKSEEILRIDCDRKASQIDPTEVRSVIVAFHFTVILADVGITRCAWVM